jgi:magnesium chelatase family protein
MLDQYLPDRLPALDEQAALEVTAIHSVAGTPPAGGPVGHPARVRGAAPPGDHGRADRGGLGLLRPDALCRVHPVVLVPGCEVIRCAGMVRANPGV